MDQILESYLQALISEIAEDLELEAKTIVEPRGQADERLAD
jgi:hypothetical protein